MNCCFAIFLNRRIFRKALSGAFKPIRRVMTAISCCHLAIAPGAQLTIYSTPGTLKALYGSHPVGAVAFLRLRPIGNQH